MNRKVNITLGNNLILYAYVYLKVVPLCIPVLQIRFPFHIYNVHVYILRLHIILKYPGFRLVDNLCVCHVFQNIVHIHHHRCIYISIPFVFPLFRCICQNAYSLYSPREPQPVEAIRIFVLHCHSTVSMYCSLKSVKKMCIDVKGLYIYIYTSEN